MTQRRASAPWFRVPRFGMTGLAFSPSLLLPLLVGDAAATLSTIACVTAVQKMNDADWRHQDPPSPCWRMAWERSWLRSSVAWDNLRALPVSVSPRHSR
ncbi:MAG: hypothetical protein WAL10_10595, partial [Acetobacteraceae bacterium]